MAKYCYPAIFTPDDGGYCVSFPDFEGCVTCGDNLGDAIFMAEDVLPLALVGLEDAKKDIPKPSEVFDLKKGEFINWIRADTIEYRKKIDPNPVEKTLSIPDWLNSIAEGIDFSRALQDALTKTLANA